MAGKNKDPYIPGIYNYCDRWCERCAFTARCLSYAFDKQDREATDRGKTADAEDPEFWNRMHEAFDTILEMVHDMAREYGVTLESVDSDDLQRQHEAERAQVKALPLVRASAEYSQAVDAWFVAEIDSLVAHGKELVALNEMGAVQRNPRGEALAMQSAVETIRWYQSLIGAKLSRAMRGRVRTDTEISATERQRDMDGSAKVALMAMDRSIEAWRRLGEMFPAKQDDLLTLLASLARMRDGTEAEFPRARQFVRPGFDTAERRPRRVRAKAPADV